MGIPFTFTVQNPSSERKAKAWTMPVHEMRFQVAEDSQDISSMVLRQKKSNHENELASTLWKMLAGQPSTTCG